MFHLLCLNRSRFLEQFRKLEKQSRPLCLFPTFQSRIHETNRCEKLFRNDQDVFAEHLYLLFSFRQRYNIEYLLSRGIAKCYIIQSVKRICVLILQLIFELLILYMAFSQKKTKTARKPTTIFQNVVFLPLFVCFYSLYPNCPGSRNFSLCGNVASNASNASGCSSATK